MLRKLLAVAAFAVVAPVAAQAQASFGIAAGASVPNGDFKTFAETGYHLMATLGIAPPALPVGLRIDGMWNEFNLKGGSSKARILGVTGNAVLSMPGAMVLSPYLIGGIGMYNQSVSPKVTGVDSANDFGFNAGAGIKFGLAGFGAFAEARFHSISNDNGSTRFIPITFGLTF